MSGADLDRFDERNRRLVAEMAGDDAFRACTGDWFARASRHEYSYHFTWLGLPVIQFPTDLVAMQEIIWSVKPDLIVETGVARGGSLVFYASMLELLGGEGRVVGIEVDLRAENRERIMGHPLARRCVLLDGSSVDPRVVERVRDLARTRQRVLVALDSLHTHDHVLRELRHYAPLVREGSYIVVFDTIIDEMPEEFSAGRPWGPGDNPGTAVREFLRSTDRFVVDESIGQRLQITVAPGGYLKCVKS